MGTWVFSLIETVLFVGLFLFVLQFLIPKSVNTFTSGENRKRMLI
jgi:hypothetical protein